MINLFLTPAQGGLFWTDAIGLHFLLQSKEEVMAVRLREADSMAAVAEMRQRIAELEIQVRGPGEELVISPLWSHSSIFSM